MTRRFRLMALAGLSASAALVAVALHRAHSYSLDYMLQASADRVNATLPVEVSNGFTLVSVHQKSRRLVYVFQLTAEGGDIEGRIARFSKARRQQVCTSAEVTPLLSQGITLEHLILLEPSSSSEVAASSFVVEEHTCQSVSI